MKLLLKLKILLAFMLLCSTGKASAIDEADIVVAQDGSGDFTTIQAAIDAVPSRQTDRRTVIYIKNGLYDTEKLIVPGSKVNVTLIGESRDQTIISYHIYDCNGGKCPEEDAAKYTGDVIRTSATLTIMAPGFRAENLTIQNTAGPVGQAQALTIRNTKCVFINCDIKGYQDTLYFWQDGIRCYFKNCLILGRTDYIYGDGIAFFDECEIRSWGGGWITAPSTEKDQPYGFVFSHCDITYATGSPRNGDDGALVRFGRPWHNYPKVAWLYCNMTEKIHPEGWGDKWNMDYSDTSPDLHLYEYMNTGPGADMSGRADWAGLRALTEEEAENYTLSAVLGGDDGWDPTAEAPPVKTFDWDGGGTNNDWLTPENWNPDTVPESLEIANVNGDITIEANGGTFDGDLTLTNGARLNVLADSRAEYLVGDNATINVGSDITFSGFISSMDTLFITSDESSIIDANFAGVKNVVKTSPGIITLKGRNFDFSGNFIVDEGSLIGDTRFSLGRADVEVKNGAKLRIRDDEAFYPESALRVHTGSTLELYAEVTVKEFYIDGVLQEPSIYDISTNPELITGRGILRVGRPASFSFTSGAWDDANSYFPAMIPLEGEIVYCEGEMETAPMVNLADIIFVRGQGSLRLRGEHTSTGTLTFEGNQRINYATSGAGFSLEAPIIIEDNINLEMSSGNVDGSVMNLTGSITGDAVIKVKNTQTSTANTSYVLLGGNNSEFSGTWDVSTAPSNSSGSTGIVGASANAFGTADIIIGNKNYVQFDHAQSTLTNVVTINTGAKAIVNTDVTVGKLILEGNTYNTGVYNSTTNPDFIEGSGSITVGGTDINDTQTPNFSVYYKNGRLYLNEKISELKIYSINGVLLNSLIINNKVVNIDLATGVYLLVSNKNQVSKLIVNN